MPSRGVAGQHRRFRGTPTTDPEDFFAGGACLPFGGEHGGHKGFAIMLAVELTGRLFTGPTRTRCRMKACRSCAIRVRPFATVR